MGLTNDSRDSHVVIGPGLAKAIAHKGQWGRLESTQHSQTKLMEETFYEGGIGVMEGTKPKGNVSQRPQSTTILFQIF